MEAFVGLDASLAETSVLRARTDRHPHLFLRAHRHGAGDESGGSPAERIVMDDPATRERRQAFSHAVPARARCNACLYRGDRHGGGPHGFPLRRMSGRRNPRPCFVSAGS